MKKFVVSSSVILMAGLLTACASESSRTLEVPKVASYQSHYQGARSPIAVGKFDNRSSYMRGIFSDGVDRLGSQAKTVLITHLQQTGRFSVLDRDNMAEIRPKPGSSNRLSNSRAPTTWSPATSPSLVARKSVIISCLASWVVASHRSPMPRST
jgi:curli biogenesis system outer membrane secretion channel CsgG